MLERKWREFKSKEEEQCSLESICDPNEGINHLEEMDNINKKISHGNLLPLKGKIDKNVKFGELKDHMETKVCNEICFT